MRKCEPCQGNVRQKQFLADASPVGIAPIAGGTLGIIERKPWDYPVTVGFAHLNTPELLDVAIGLWQAQTVKPYIIIVDTGSPQDLERYRAPNVEIHYVKGHAYSHSSEPIMLALDLIHARCQTARLLHTHADVFPRRRDLIEHFSGLCTAETPVVGYEMSPRAGLGRDKWRGTVSHTCTMIYMPTARRKRWTWNYMRYCEIAGHAPSGTMGWPDTESGFALCLNEDRRTPLLLGPEPNYERHQTDFFDHARSYTGLKLSGGKQWAAAEEYTRLALTEAKARLAAWQ